MIPTEAQVRIVRTLIPDKEAIFGAAGDEYMFTDEDIEDFFTAGGGSVLRAAAHANQAIATSEALISKQIRTQDLQTNGAAVANSLLERARQLFQQADQEDARANAEFFEIIDYGEGWSRERPELTEYSVY